MFRQNAIIRLDILNFTSSMAKFKLVEAALYKLGYEFLQKHMPAEIFCYHPNIMLDLGTSS